MPECFRHDVTFRWSDGDLQGVVNNAVYLTAFEEARFGYFRSLDALRGTSFPFLLGSTSLRFLRPGRVGSTVTVAARVTRLGNASFDMRYEVDDSQGRLVDGEATLVWVDASLRSTPIPDEVRLGIAAREGIDSRSAR